MVLQRYVSRSTFAQARNEMHWPYLRPFLIHYPCWYHWRSFHHENSLEVGERSPNIELLKPWNMYFQPKTLFEQRGGFECGTTVCNLHWLSRYNQQFCLKKMMLNLNWSWFWLILNSSVLLFFHNFWFIDEDVTYLGVAVLGLLVEKVVLVMELYPFWNCIELQMIFALSRNNVQFCCYNCNTHMNMFHIACSMNQAV